MQTKRIFRLQAQINKEITCQPWISVSQAVSISLEWTMKRTTTTVNPFSNRFRMGRYHNSRMGITISPKVDSTTSSCLKWLSVLSHCMKIMSKVYRARSSKSRKKRLRCPVAAKNSWIWVSRWRVARKSVKINLRLKNNWSRQYHILR